ncbi:DNA repair and recombination protein RAD54 [Acorus calamus]|uniref:DNA repair and recombination protein RAD54 n=1 Tax=Acorus calamus TaxID=4465 RepID=A0AAV9FIF9_ACOCL|nr:DNA repair and recombination protein RAD54 [Acorus calamus]
MAENDKPLSLNERNDRLLQTLSLSSAPEGRDNPVKVKIQGRRRLCKLSSSPPQPPPADDVDPTVEDAVPEIRDILNDLTSRLECLSVDNKGSRRPSKAADDHPEFESATSSLSSALSAAGGFGSPESAFGGEDEKVEAECVDSVTARHESMETSQFVEEVDGDDDCVVINERVWSQPSFELVPDEGVDENVILIDDDDELEVSDPSESVDKDDDGDCITLESLGLGTYTLPGKIARILFSHQRDGLRWLWSLHCKGGGGILGDDMGLGKTMQISAYLAGLFHSCLIRRVLIVAPKTLLAHWTKELSVVGLSKRIGDYYCTCQKMRQLELNYVLQDGGILLTTYDIVRNNSKSIRGDFYIDEDPDDDGIIWDYIILDEGHIIKNPSTQRAKSLLDIPSTHRVIISGTPLQNNLKELWALFNFCCPEILGDKKEFKEKYEYPILRGNDKNASDREKRVGSTVAQKLRERIKPYFLRRLKSEVFLGSDATKGASFPKKNEIIVWLRLTHCQRQLYEAFLKSEQATSAINGSPLAALTVLKKICEHPFLLTKRAAEGVLEGMDTVIENEDLNMEQLALRVANMALPRDAQQQDDMSCKICFLMSLLDNLVMEGHSILIFSQTRKMLNLIQETILSRGYTFLRIDGTTKACDREKIVNDFQNGRGAQIFLLTSQVGGLGLTLTKADRVIVVDPAWNPSTDNQSVDRAYRIGQKNDVLVYRLMTCGTIEEKIYKMQIYKGGLFKTATEQKEQTRYFSKSDLKELFSLPKQGFDVSLTQQQLLEEHGCPNMGDSLKKHINFLEEQGIGGISHHSLVFSKTAPVQLMNDDEEVSKTGNKILGGTRTSSLTDQYVDGAEYAIKPKDFKSSSARSPATVASDEAKYKAELHERINRLCQTFADKALILKLPDKGKKIEKQIIELKLELGNIENRPPNCTSEIKKQEVIDLDGLSVEMQRVLSVSK